MLADHGKMAAATRRAGQHGRFVLLGDYEWILAFEADELYRIVDLMRLLRASEAGCTSAKRSPSTPAAARHLRAVAGLA